MLPHMEKKREGKDGEYGHLLGSDSERQPDDRPAAKAPRLDGDNDAQASNAAAAAQLQQKQQQQNLSLPQDSVLAAVLENSRKQQERSDLMMQQMFHTMQTQQIEFARMISSMSGSGSSGASVATSQASLSLTMAATPKVEVSKSIPGEIASILDKQKADLEKSLWKRIKHQERLDKTKEAAVKLTEGDLSGYPAGVPVLHIPSGPPELLEGLEGARDDDLILTLKIDKGAARSEVMVSIYRWAWAHMKRIEVEALEAHAAILRQTVTANTFVRACQEAVKKHENDRGFTLEMEDLAQPQPAVDPERLCSEAAKLYDSASMKVRARWQKHIDDKKNKKASDDSAAALVDKDPAEIFRSAVAGTVRDVLGARNVEGFDAEMNSSEEEQKDSATDFVEAMSKNGQSPGEVQGPKEGGGAKPPKHHKGADQFGKGKGKSKGKGKGKDKKGKGKGKGKGLGKTWTRWNENHGGKGDWKGGKNGKAGGKGKGYPVGKKGQKGQKGMSIQRRTKPDSQI